MPALKPWRYGLGLVVAALLFVGPASAQDPTPTPTATPTPTPTPTDSESDIEEPDSAELQQTLRLDMLQQAGDIEEILITGEKQNTLQDAPTSSTTFATRTSAPTR